MKGYGAKEWFRDHPEARGVPAKEEKTLDKKENSTKEEKKTSNKTSVEKK